MADTSGDAKAGCGEREAPRAVWVRPLGVLFGWLVLLVVLLWFFQPLSTVLLGLLAVAIATSTLSPVVRRVPAARGLAAILLVFATVFVVGLLFYALSYPLAQPIRERFTRDWPTVRDSTTQLLRDWHKRLGLKGEPPTAEEMVGQIGSFLVGKRAQEVVSGTADVVLALLVSLALVIFGTIFFLAEPPDDLLRNGLRMLSPPNRAAALALIGDLAPRYRRWVLGTATGMAVVFTASVIGFSLLGIRVAVPLAILAGLAEIVPTVGPAIAAVALSLITLATETGPKAVGVLTVYGLIQLVEAYFVLPLIMRGAVKIHPAITLFSVVLWGKVFGVPGLMLAIPLNLTIWCAIEHFWIRRHEGGTASPAETS